MHMRTALLLGILVPAAALAGCTTELTTSNFELRAGEVGWKAGQTAFFSLRFLPDGAGTARYDVDPLFAVTEVRFEQEGLNVLGDYETKRAQDLSLAILVNGSPVENFTLTPAQHTVQIRVQIPDTLDNGEYTLELKLFKVGWVVSDVFRVAI